MDSAVRVWWTIFINTLNIFALPCTQKCPVVTWPFLLLRGAATGQVTIDIDVCIRPLITAWLQSCIP